MKNGEEIDGNEVNDDGQDEDDEVDDEEKFQFFYQDTSQFNRIFSNIPDMICNDMILIFQYLLVIC